jgi:hypothetical protein
VAVSEHFAAYRDYNFEKVFGWCNPKLLTFLEAADSFQKETGIQGSVGEIGVQCGKLFIALHNLLSVRPETSRVI